MSLKNVKDNEVKMFYKCIYRVFHSKHCLFLGGGPPPLRQHVFSTKNKQKLAFSDVIYEWSLNEMDSVMLLINKNVMTDCNKLVNIASYKLQ